LKDVMLLPLYHIFKKVKDFVNNLLNQLEQMNTLFPSRKGPLKKLHGIP
jgi:hypothetical protein